MQQAGGGKRVGDLTVGHPAADQRLHAGGSELVHEGSNQLAPIVNSLLAIAIAIK